MRPVGVSWDRLIPFQVTVSRGVIKHWAVCAAPLPFAEMYVKVYGHTLFSLFLKAPNVGRSERVREIEGPPPNYSEINPAPACSMRIASELLILVVS